MGKADPLLRQIYVRHIRYKAFYPAKSGLLSRCRAGTSQLEMTHATERTSQESPWACGPAAARRTHRRRDSPPTGWVLLTGWTYRGPDMMSAAPAEMDALSARLNSVLRMGSGWMVQCDAIRSRAPGYPERGAFPDCVTRVIDDERRQQFMQEGAHYESEYFLTLTYLPPLAAEERIKGWMFEGGGPHSANRTRPRSSTALPAALTYSRTCSVSCSKPSA